MKKLGKLNLNEMQDFAPLSPEEQMAMKGGFAGLWIRIIYMAWQISKDISNEINGGSGSNQSQGVPGSGITRVYGPDSVEMADGTKIYYPDSLYIGSGN